MTSDSPPVTSDPQHAGGEEQTPSSAPVAGGDERQTSVPIGESSAHPVRPWTRLIAIATLVVLAIGSYLYFRTQRTSVPVDAGMRDEAPAPTGTDARPAPVAVAATTSAPPVATPPADEDGRPGPTAAPGTQHVVGEAAEDSQQIAAAGQQHAADEAHVVAAAQERIVREIESRLAALETRVAALGPLESPDEKATAVLRGAAGLVTLAEQRLLLARDTAGATTALRLAAAQLQDGEFPAQRRALATDLATLATFHDVDVGALAMELARFAHEAPSLRFAAPAPGAPPPPARIESWRSLFAAIWASLRGLVEVHDADPTRDPLLNPVYATLGREQLALDLSAARSVALQRDAAAFRAALQPAIEELAERFDSADPAVVRMLARLRAMQELDLAPPLPALERSVAAFTVAGQPSDPPAGLDVPDAERAF